MDLNKLGFDTLALHAGFSGDACEGSTEVPIHQTSAYRFRSTQHAQELFELRLMLETECIGMAATKITDEQLEHIRQTITGASIDDPEAFSAADIEMHKTIYMATGNLPLQLIMETINGWNVENRQYTNSFVEVRRIVQRDHVDIYCALQHRDPESCRKSMRQHILHLQKIDDISRNALQQSYSNLLASSTWAYQDPGIVS